MQIGIAVSVKTLFHAAQVNAAFANVTVAAYSRATRDPADPEPTVALIPSWNEAWYGIAPPAPVAPAVAADPAASAAPAAAVAAPDSSGDVKRIAVTVSAADSTSLRLRSSGASSAGNASRSGDAASAAVARADADAAAGAVAPAAAASGGKDAAWRLYLVVAGGCPKVAVGPLKITYALVARYFILASTLSGLIIKYL